MPLPDALAHWHDFYSLVGTASATMIGLLFVAVSVASGMFTNSRRAALRVFLSASVVNFSSILVSSMLVMAPIGSWLWFGLSIGACGLFGLTHTGLAAYDTVRDGLLARIDLEDRTWYLFMPFIGYLLEAGAGVALVLRFDPGCAALALSTGVLMVVGIHNAWDITVWSLIRRRE